MRTIFHLDLDAFFVSVERVLDPTLNGKPVIVGGDPHGRGVVTACSYEARKYGLHSAMPIRKAYKLCPHGTYIHGSHGEYSRFSKAVKNILEGYAPVIEQASIDEFYMDFTGCTKIYGSLFMFASRIQKEIKEKVLLPSSIGIASNKTVAKIASDCMKPEGITYVLPGMEKEFLAPMPVETIPGVGKVMHKELNEKGIYLIGDITAMPEDYFGAAFGKYGIDLWHKAHGEGKGYINPPQARKSVSKERTYGKDVTSKDKIEETLFKLTGQVCQILRDKNWQASTISIKLRYSDFTTITRAKTIKATDDDRIIFETAVKLFRSNYKRRVSVRLIGIHLTKFSEFCEQEFLFDEEGIRRKKMLRAVTKLRDKFGYSVVQFGRKEKVNNHFVNPFHPEMT